MEHKCAVQSDGGLHLCSSHSAHPAPSQLHSALVSNPSCPPPLLPASKGKPYQHAACAHVLRKVHALANLGFIVHCHPYTIYVLWALCRSFDPKMGPIARVLWASLPELLHVGVVLVVSQVMIAIMGMALFGDRAASFATLSGMPKAHCRCLCSCARCRCLWSCARCRCLWSCTHGHVHASDCFFTDVPSSKQTLLQL